MKQRKQWYSATLELSHSIFARLHGMPYDESQRKSDWNAKVQCALFVLKHLKEKYSLRVSTKEDKKVVTYAITFFRRERNENMTNKLPVWVGNSSINFQGEDWTHRGRSAERTGPSGERMIQTQFQPGASLPCTESALAYFDEGRVAENRFEGQTDRVLLALVTTAT